MSAPTRSALASDIAALLDGIDAMLDQAADTDGVTSWTKGARLEAYLGHAAVLPYWRLRKAFGRTEA